jgi:molecular chaperone GrpE
MSDEKNGAAAPEDAAPGTAETAVSDAALAERVIAAETELAETKDRLLRALAETENVRRRAQREREDAGRYGASNFARDLVNVADNLRRALASVPEGGTGDELTRTLLQGVSATERELLSAFERHGIRRIEPLGERFDHNFHQAIFEVEDSGQPPGTVVQVLQPGYVMHDRLLRPAMVAVAKGARPADAPRIDEVV